MSSIPRIGMATPEPSDPQQPEKQSGNAPMSSTMKALIEAYFADAKLHEQKSIRLEQESRETKTTPAYCQYAASKAYDYRNMAAGEIGAIAALLREALPDASYEQRCEYLQRNMHIHVDDENRVWNAFLAGY